MNAGFNNPNWTINNQENKNSVERFLSNVQLDLRITGRLWIGSKPANVDFENN